jgi:hypothetical protein
MLYVLTHGSFQIVDTPHKGEVLGQKFDLPDDLAKREILRGAALLPEDAFNGIGFTPEEIGKYSNAVRQAAAPSSFITKHAQALTAVREYRMLLAEAPAEEVK